MLNRLMYPPESSDCFKYGDTNTTITIQLKGDNVNLSTAKSIDVKIGQENVFIQTQSIVLSDQAALPTNKIRIKSTDELFSGLNPGNYFIEVWVIDENYGVSIFPSHKYPETSKFTIYENIESYPIIGPIPVLTLESFQKQFDEFEQNITNANLEMNVSIDDSVWETIQNIGNGVEVDV